MCIKPLLNTVYETAFKIKNDINNVVGVFRPWCLWFSLLTSYSIVAAVVHDVQKRSFHSLKKQQHKCHLTVGGKQTCCVRSTAAPFNYLTSYPLEYKAIFISATFHWTHNNRHIVSSPGCCQWAFECDCRWLWLDSLFCLLSRITHTTWVYPLTLYPPFLGFYFFNGLMFVLQILHIFWAALILRMVVKFLPGNVRSSTRSHFFPLFALKP